jgi:cell division protein FtsI/penicillin-binding protein 2
MQIACAYAAIANGGVWHTPRLVAQVGHDVVQPEAGRRVVSRPVARQVVKMMSEAVEDGTGTAFQIPGYRTAGKTGTAEKPDPRHGGYAKGKYVASFVGIVPADHPSLIVVVMVDEPQGQIWGAAVAAPAAQKIAVFALQHLKIAP